jgi:hypothetical protein
VRDSKPCSDCCARSTLRHRRACQRSLDASHGAWPSTSGVEVIAATEVCV